MVKNGSIMKKFTSIILMAVVAMVSCNTEIIPEDKLQKEEVNVNDFQGPVFTAVSNSFNRTAITDNGSVKWVKNDAISIFDGTRAKGWADGFTKDVRYSVVNSLLPEDGSSAVFVADGEENQAVDGASVYYAMCPRNSGASCDVEKGVFDVWVIDSQKGVKNNFSEDRTVAGRHMNISVAKTTDPENEALQFKNALAHLKVTIPESLDKKITHIAVWSLGGEYLAGDTEIIWKDDADPEVTARYKYNNSGNGSKYPQVFLFPDTESSRYKLNGATFDAGTYYIAVRPTVLSKGLLIEYRTDASGTVSTTVNVTGKNANGYNIEAQQITYKNVELKRGHVYDMGVIGGKSTKAPAGVGITELPYTFSFYCESQTNGSNKYVTAGSMSEVSYTMPEGALSAWSFRQYKGVVAREKDATIGASMEFSSFLEYKGSSTKTVDKAFNNWAQNQAHDNFNTGDFVTRYSVAGLPFECGLYLNVPLQTNLPAKFNVAFGIGYMGTWGLKDWDVYYSNNNSAWVKGGRITLSDAVTSGKNYKYYNVDITPIYAFKAGDILYLKLCPVGNNSISGNGCDGIGTGNSGNGNIRFHSGITISPVEVAGSQRPSDAVLYEGFDSFKGGLDYFIGDRLAGMANYCGDTGTLSGFTADRIYQRPGYAQIGYVESQKCATDKDMSTMTYKGTLTTPALGKAGDLTLSFKACAFRSPAARENVYADSKIDGYNPDATSITVKVIGGGTIDGAESITIENLSTSEWNTYTKTIEGATADTKIEFSSPSVDGKLFYRWFLDDLYVK